mgnify:CR=1 FL=1
MDPKVRSQLAKIKYHRVFFFFFFIIFLVHFRNTNNISFLSFFLLFFKKKPYFITIVIFVQLAMLAYELILNNQIYGKPIEEMDLNPFAGPAASTIVLLGAKYAPCMRPSTNAELNHFGVKYFFFFLFFFFFFFFFLFCFSNSKSTLAQLIKSLVVREQEWNLLQTRILQVVHFMKHLKSFVEWVSFLLFIYLFVFFNNFFNKNLLFFLFFFFFLSRWIF